MGKITKITAIAAKNCNKDNTYTVSEEKFLSFSKKAKKFFNFFALVLIIQAIASASSVDDLNFYIECEAFDTIETVIKFDRNSLRDVDDQGYGIERAILKKLGTAVNKEIPGTSYLISLLRVRLFDILEKMIKKQEVKQIRLLLKTFPELIHGKDRYGRRITDLFRKKSSRNIITKLIDKHRRKKREKELNRIGRDVEILANGTETAVKLIKTGKPKAILAVLASEKMVSSLYWFPDTKIEKIISHAVDIVAKKNAELTLDELEALKNFKKAENFIHLETFKKYARLSEIISAGNMLTLQDVIEIYWDDKAAGLGDSSSSE